MENQKMTRSEIERLLNESQLETEQKEIEEQKKPGQLKEIRKGILAFTLIHLLLEVVFSLVEANMSIQFKAMYTSVLLNFFISFFYAKWYLNKHTINSDKNLFNFGVKVSFFVFVIRIIVGGIVLMTLLI
jgi:hypothetical protein